MPDVSFHVVDADTGQELLSEQPDRVRPTASVVKVLVLAALARAIEAGDVAEDEVLRRDATPPVADSGLWHLMGVDALPVADVALLVASVSDNWATNVLVERLGLDAVNDTGLAATRMLDLVRDERGPDDAETVGVGTARELAGVMAALHRGDWVSPGVSARVLDWLASGVDHSLVLAAVGHDPLVVDRQVLGKTGADADVRCDVGLLRRPGRAAAYACLGRGDPPVLVATTRALGAQVLALL